MNRRPRAAARRLHWRRSTAAAVGLCVLALGLPLSSSPAERARGRPGPALRSGLTALDAGANDTAGRLFARTRQTHPIIADHAARWEAEALLRAGHPEEAAERATEAAAANPRGLLAGALARIEAESHSRLGEHEAARNAWMRAAKLESDHDDRAELLARVARSYESEGDATSARDTWLEVWSELPETPSGAESIAELERLDTGPGPRRGDPAILRARCDALTDQRRNEAALETCSVARSKTRDASGARLLDRRRADLLFRLRRYSEAHRAYAALPDREARFRAARSLARSGRSEESISVFEALGKGKDLLAARARFSAGTLWEEQDAERANRHYRSVAEHAPSASLRREANWRLGWAAYSAGRYTEAEGQLSGVALDSSDPLDALRGRYWSAQSALRAGDSEGAERLAEIAREYPFTYYGWRASSAARPRATDEPQTSAGPQTSARPQTSAEPQTSVEPPAHTVSRLPVRSLERARILVEAGLREDAARELASIRRLARTRADRLLLSSLLQDAEDHHRALRIILDVHLLDLARGPGGGAPDLWWSAYPSAYAAHVESAVANREVDIALVYAVMREESGYRPKVLSVVGARGLAQIMPETGKRLASQLGDNDFHPDDLYQPERNLELAAHYLESLMQRFDGRTSAAVASYNAGPAAVARWVAADGNLRDDEWVETIPYDQTRAYVKRVLRSVYAYEVLY